MMLMTNVRRVENRAALNKSLEDPIRNVDSQELIEALIAANVPAGLIRDMQEVFENPMAKQMILKERKEDGVESLRVKTVAFEIEWLLDVVRLSVAQ